MVLGKTISLYKRKILLLDLISFRKINSLYIKDFIVRLKLKHSSRVEENW